MPLKKIIVRLLLLGLFLMVAFVGYFFYYLGFVVTGPRGETPFALAHERAVRTFVEGQRFGITRFREREYFHERSVVLDDQEWSVLRVALIGASAEYGERYFVESWVPIKKEVGETEHRELNPDEARAIAELRGGRKEYVILENSESPRISDRFSQRVIAPVLAEQSCLKCHQAEVGDLLGAFDYFLQRRRDEIGE